MSRRFINCSACKGCHTGRGGQYCKFAEKPGQLGLTTGTAMSSAWEDDPDAPDRESAEYVSYLANKIEEEQERLKSLQDKCRVAAMEEQLSKLRIQSAELTAKQVVGHQRAAVAETGVAADLLAAARGGPPGSGQTAGPSPGAAASPLSAAYMQRSKEEKDTLSKLKALNHLPESKPAEKVTYREFICAMTKVLKLINELGIDSHNYIAHMCFIATKAAKNVYATDALIKYDEDITDRVITGQYSDWVPADPECVALHLGPDATYTIRQGGGRWTRQSPGNFGGSFGGSRDFSDWPKEICWLFNNTSCYFPRCKKSHICAKCKRTGHPMKDCKNGDDAASPNPPKVLSTKPQKEVRKP